MTVQCLTCGLFRLKESDLAKNGFGFCQLRRTKGEFVSGVFPRECRTHKQAKPEVIEERKKFYETRREKKQWTEQ